MREIAWLFHFYRICGSVGEPRTARGLAAESVCIHTEGKGIPNQLVQGIPPEYQAPVLYRLLPVQQESNCSNKIVKRGTQHPLSNTTHSPPPSLVPFYLRLCFFFSCLSLYLAAKLGVKRSTSRSPVRQLPRRLLGKHRSKVTLRLLLSDTQKSQILGQS